LVGGLIRRHAAPLTALLGAAVLVTWPLVPRLGRELPGHEQSDVWEHAWGYAWFAGCARSLRFPWHTTEVAWPGGGTLWFADALGAWLALPLAPLGPALAYGAAVLGLVFSAMLAMYALARHQVGDGAAAVLAGVIYGGSAFVLTTIHSGTSEYLHLGALPALWLALERRSVRGAVAAWAWATWASAYYAAFAGILLILAGAGWRFTTRVVLGWSLVGAPALALMGLSVHVPDAIVTPDSAPGWRYADLPAVDLLTLVHPGDYAFPDLARGGNLGIRHSGYLGLAALALAVAGLRSARDLRVPVAVSTILAMGPRLCVAGVATAIPLPLALLYVQGSPFRFVHHPFRLVVLPMLFVALAAARAVRGRRAVVATVAVLADVLLLSPATWPLATSDASLPAEEAADGPVLDYPPDARGLSRRWIWLQALRGRSTPYAPNDYVPRSIQEDPALEGWIACLDRARFTSRDGAPGQRWTATGERLSGLTVRVHDAALTAPERRCVANLPP
jgi:hypothetical protein